MSTNDYLKMIKEALEIEKETCPESISYDFNMRLQSWCNGYLHAIFAIVLKQNGFDDAKFIEVESRKLAFQYFAFLEDRIR